jgi:hypothetical protein
MSNFNSYLNNVVSHSENIELDSEAAKDFFERNVFEGQRNIKPALLKKHMENIQNGQFFGSQIVIGKYRVGRRWVHVILDGQHRLKAIIKSNTNNKYLMNILTIELRSKDECKLYYQFFNNKTSARTLADLIKFKLGHSENKGRWSHPVELVQALPYATGHYFTPGGIKKFSSEQNRTMSKLEFLSDLIELERYHNAFDFLQGNAHEGKEGIRNKFGKQARKMTGVKGYGAVIDSYIRHPAKAKEFWEKFAEHASQYIHEGDNSDIPSFWRGIFDRIWKVLQTQDFKGTQNVPKIFYILWKSFDQYRHGNENFRNAGLSEPEFLSINNEDVVNKCFANGLALRQLTVPN